MKIIWRDQARNDLKGDMQFLRKRNPTAALSISATILARVKLLAQHPHLGRAGRVENTRELVIAGTQYVVIYTVDTVANLVVILRVLHGKRLWPTPPEDESE